MEFFAGANCRYGFKSLFDETFEGIERLYILKGSSGCGKSTLMKRIGLRAQKAGIESDIIYCSADPDSLDGIIFPSLGIAIADGTAPHVMDVKYPCVRETIINLGQFWDESKLLPHQKKIIGLTDLKSAHYKNAYRALASMGNIDELLDELLSPCIDRKKLDAFAFKLAEKFFGRKGRQKQVFATAFTAEGIKGLPVFGKVKTLYRINGKGDTALMTALERIAKETGIEAVISRNPIDPRKPDSIYIPEKGLLITILALPPCKAAKEEHTVSTARFIDTSKTATVKNRLRGLEKLHNELEQTAMLELTEARSIHKEIEDIYIPAMDFKSMDDYTSALGDRIFGA